MNNTEAGRQELGLRRGRASFLRAVKEIRARCGIDPARLRQLNRGAARDWRCFEVVDEYRAKITRADISELERLSDIHVLPSMWRGFVMFDEKEYLGTTARYGAGIIMHRPQTAPRMFLAFSKGTSIAAVKSTWKSIRRNRARLSKPLRVGTVPRIDARGGEIRLEIFRSTRLHHVIGIWDKLRKIQRTMPGPGQFRIKRNIGRDATALRKRELGKGMGRIYWEMSDFPSGNTDVKPDAYRKAIQRRKARLL